MAHWPLMAGHKRHPPRGTRPSPHAKVQSRWRLPALPLPVASLHLAVTSTAADGPCSRPAGCGRKLRHTQARDGPASKPRPRGSAVPRTAAARLRPPPGLGRPPDAGRLTRRSLGRHHLQTRHAAGRGLLGALRRAAGGAVPGVSAREARSPPPHLPAPRGHGDEPPLPPRHAHWMAPRLAPAQRHLRCVWPEPPRNRGV